MTSRELTDAIDHLIVLRIQEGRYVIELGNQQQRLESLELTKLAISDALKLLDHRPGGVYGDGKES